MVILTILLGLILGTIASFNKDDVINWSLWNAFSLMFISFGLNGII